MSIKVIQCCLWVISGSIGSSKPEAFTEGQLSNTYANLTYHYLMCSQYCQIMKGKSRELGVMFCEVKYLSLESI